MDPAAQARIREVLAPNAYVSIQTYPGRCHAFARPNGHHYHAADAETTHARTQAFFKRHLA